MLEKHDEHIFMCAVTAVKVRTLCLHLASGQGWRGVRTFNLHAGHHGSPESSV